MLSTPSKRALFTTFALTSTLLGCSDGPRPAFRIEVVNAQGQSPILGVATGRIDVTVTQRTDRDVEERRSATIEGGTFQLEVPVSNYASLTHIDIDLLRDGALLYGSTVEFSPLYYGFIRIVMVPAGTCETVSTQALATPRAGHAMLTLGDLTFGIGGVRADGAPIQSIEGWGTAQLTNVLANQAPDQLDQAEPQVRAVPLDFYSALIAGSRFSIYDKNPELPAAELNVPLAGVHEGAGEFSALADLGTNFGVAIIGGVSAPSISWVLSRTVTTSALPQPRREATAMRLASGSELLVVGGNDDGNALGAIVPTSAGLRNNVVSFGPTDARRGGWLAASPDRRSALYIGSRDGTDTLTPETFLITGCPTACTVTPGPMWNEARENATFVDDPDGTTWILGGLEGAASVSTVERIEWDGAVPRFTTSGALRTPRESAAAVHLAGGMILISGGRNGATMLSDFELCAPSSR